MLRECPSAAVVDMTSENSSDQKPIDKSSPGNSESNSTGNIVDDYAAQSITSRHADIGLIAPTPRPATAQKPAGNNPAPPAASSTNKPDIGLVAPVSNDIGLIVPNSKPDIGLVAAPSNPIGLVLPTAQPDVPSDQTSITSPALSPDREPIAPTSNYTGSTSPASNPDTGLIAPTGTGAGSAAIPDGGTTASIHKSIVGKTPALKPAKPSPEKFSAIPLEPSDLHAGDVLFEDFILKERIGAGRGSIVYRSDHKLTDRVLALKTTMYHEVFVRQAFSKAAIAHMTLGHKNIVASIAALESEQQRPFYFTEFLDGVTIVELIDSTGPLEDILEINEIVGQICDALQFAHDKNITHGNLTANNVMLMDTGDRILVKVLDFGFASVLDEIEKSEGKREQAQPTRDSQSFEQQKQNDISMLAQLLIGMVTGVPIPETAPIAPVNLTTTHYDDPNFPVEGLEVLLNRALAQDPSERFQSISDFKTAFESWAAQAVKEEADWEEPDESEIYSKVESATKKRNPKKTSLRIQLLELATLRKNQVREEESLALVLTGAFATQGPRQSPVKTFATLTTKIVTAVLVGVLSLSFLILNWDKLGELWVQASTNLSLAVPGKHNDELRRQLEEEALLEAATKKQAEKEKKRQADIRTATNKATSAAASMPINSPPRPRRFRYDEHPLYHHWVLKDVGPVRRMKKSGR